MGHLEFIPTSLELLASAFLGLFCWGNRSAMVSATGKVLSASSASGPSQKMLGTAARHGRQGRVVPQPWMPVNLQVKQSCHHDLVRLGLHVQDSCPPIVHEARETVASRGNLMISSSFATL